MDASKKALKEIGLLLEESKRTDNLLRAYLETISKSFRVKRVSLMLVDASRRELFIRESQGLAPALKNKIRVRIGEGISGWVAAKGESVVVRDIDRSRQQFRQVKKTSGFRSGSFISLPLKLKGAVYGVLNVSEKKDGTSFSRNELKRLEFFGLQLAILVENEALRKEIKRLEKKPVEAIAEASHDFRIPLTCVQEALNILESGDLGSVTDQQREFLALARRNVDRMLLAFDELICLASGKGPGGLQRKEVDIAELFGDLARDFNALARKKNVRIEIRHPEKGLTIFTDGMRLREVLMNFLDNAIKYAPENSAVTFNAVRADGSIRLAVEDKGSGISETLRKTLFDREAAAKRRGETAPSRGSHGLGLIIAADIAAALGGRAGYEPAPGGGSIFYVKLPEANGQAKKK